MKRSKNRQRFDWCWGWGWRNNGTRNRIGCPMGDWCPIHGNRENFRQELVGWALIFIFGALVILADITNFSSNFSWWNAWAVFFVGFGIITLIGMFIYLFKGRVGRVIWNLFWGLIFLAIGLRNFANTTWVWVVILAVIGIALLRRAFWD